MAEDTDTLVDEREDERQPGDERLPIQPAPQPSIVPRGTSAIQPPREAAPAIAAPPETAAPPVAGAPIPAAPPLPGRPTPPQQRPINPAVPPPSPGQFAVQHLSDTARQNPFSVLMAKEDNISNPFLRVLAKIGTAAGRGAETLSPDYPAIQADRIRAAEEPGQEAERAAQTKGIQAETEQKEAQTARMKSGQLPIKNPIAIYSGNEQVGEEGYDENGQFHRNMFPGAGEAPAGPAGPQGPPARMPSAAQGGGGAAPVPAAAAPPARTTTQKPQEPQRAPLPTPAEQAKLAPVGTEADRYNKEIQGVLGKEAADYAVKPTDSAEKAEKTLADARARATELEKGKSAERAANAPIAAEERKDARLMGYAMDKDGNLAYMSKADADKLHSTFEEMKPGDVKADRQSLRQLNDIQQNVSRYKSATNAIKGNISPDAASAMAGILSDKELGAKLEPFGVGLDIGQLNDAFTQTTKARYWNKLNPEEQDAVLGYLRAKSSIIAYNKVLSGSARAAEKQLEIEMQQLPTPYVGATVGNKQLNAFQENIDRASEGFPTNLPGIKSPKQVRAEAEAPKQTTAAPTQEPARPASVPAGYNWNPSGPKGPGWYR